MTVYFTVVPGLAFSKRGIQVSFSCLTAALAGLRCQ